MNISLKIQDCQEHDHNELRDIVEGYLDRLIEVKKENKIQIDKKKKIEVLSEEAAAVSVKNDDFEAHIAKKVRKLCFN